MSTWNSIKRLPFALLPATRHRQIHPRLGAADRRVIAWMGRHGHWAHRWGLAAFFIWMGLLKQFGADTGSSILAQTIFWGSRDLLVPLLGWWEVAIGVCLLLPPLMRLGLLLLAIRLPGTVLALFFHTDVTFESFPLAPTVAGQYLLKDALLFTAALIVGSRIVPWHPDDRADVRDEPR